MNKPEFMLSYIMARAQVQTENLDAATATASAAQAWDMIVEAHMEEEERAAAGDEPTDLVAHERIPMGFDLSGGDQDDEPEEGDDE